MGKKFTTLKSNLEDDIKTSEWTSGVISPDGTFYGCPNEGHWDLAYNLIEDGILPDDSDVFHIYERQGWLKLTHAYSVEIEFIFDFEVEVPQWVKMEDGEKASWVDIREDGKYKHVDVETQMSITDAQIGAMMDYKIARGHRWVNFNHNWYFVEDLEGLFQDGKLKEDYYHKSIDSPKEVGNKARGLILMNKAGVKIPEFKTITSSRLKYFEKGDWVTRPNGQKVSIRSSPYVSMPGLLNTILNVDSNSDEEISDAVFGVKKAIESKKVRDYCDKMDVSPWDIKMGIVIQEMIDTTKGGIGVCVIDSNGIEFGEYLRNELGDKLMAGKKTPISITELPSSLLSQLTNETKKIFNLFLRQQEVEFG